MNRWRVLAKATLIEILSEPFAFLVLMASVAVAVMAPAMHYHQFGEPARMARDAGISAMLIGGGVIAAFGSLKTFRREIESGTAQAALAHPVSRSEFFLAKAVGSFAAFLVFAFSIACVSMTTVNGAEIGGLIASNKGEIARLWGPSYSLALATLFAPIAVAAILNRFCRFRFCLSANLLTLAIAVASSLYRFDITLAARYLPVIMLAAVPQIVLSAAGAAFAVRFAFNAAASLTALVAALMLPVLGDYCLSDAIVGRAPAPYGYIAIAVLAMLPLVAAFLLLGVNFMKGRDVA